MSLYFFQLSPGVLPFYRQFAKIYQFFPVSLRPALFTALYFIEYMSLLRTQEKPGRPGAPSFSKGK